MSCLENPLDNLSNSSSSLEVKLKEARDEIERLKGHLRSREIAYQDLQEECNYKTARTADLEQHYKKQSATIRELWENVGSRSRDEFQEKLLVTSLQNAEYAHEIEKLRMQIQGLKSNLKFAENERAILQEKNSALVLKLNATTASRDGLLQNREIDQKLLLELSDIVRALNCVHVSYEREEKKIDLPISIHELQGHSIQNIKRKIEAIESDRKLQVKENEFLREENDLKEKKIRA